MAGFWAGFAQAIREEDQQEHERELFQEKINAARDTEWLKRRMARQQQEQEEAIEAERIIRRGATIPGIDLDISAALYQSGQLGDLLVAYEDGIKDGKVNEQGFELVARNVREQMGDDLEGLGSQLIETLRTSADLTTPTGQQDAIINSRTGGKTIEELSTETPPVSSVQGSVPAFDLQFDPTRDPSLGETRTGNSIVNEKLTPLLADQINFKTDPNTGEVMVAGYNQNDPNARGAGRLLNNAQRRYRQLTTGPDAIDPTEAASLIYDFVNTQTDPNVTEQIDFGRASNDILNLQPSYTAPVPASTPQTPPVPIDTPEDAQRELGNTGPEIVPAPTPPADRPDPYPTGTVTAPDPIEIDRQELDGRETSSWSNRVWNTARER